MWLCNWTFNACFNRVNDCELTETICYFKSITLNLILDGENKVVFDAKISLFHKDVLK